MINNNRANLFRDWLQTSINPILSYRVENKTVINYLKQVDELKVSLEWVYGFRCSDVKRPLQYTVGRRTAVSTGKRNYFEKKMLENSEELVFFTACIVVLYSPKVNQQRFYLQHEVSRRSPQLTPRSKRSFRSPCRRRAAT